MKKIFILAALLSGLSSVGQQIAPGSKTGDTVIHRGIVRMPDIPTGLGTKQLRVDGSGKLFATDTTIILAHGTYTPTITNGINMAASTAYVLGYLRVGNSVTVWGQIDFDPTAATTNTAAEITLPIASDFTAIGDAGGSAGIQYADLNVLISAQITNNRVIFQYIPVDAANNIFIIKFSYLIK